MMDNYVKVSVRVPDGLPAPAHGALVSWTERGGGRMHSYCWPCQSSSVASVRDAFAGASELMSQILATYQKGAVDARLSCWNPGAILRHELFAPARIGDPLDLVPGKDPVLN